MCKTVVHYKAGPFLPLTENWIFNQLVRLERYRPIVYCHGITNLDMFKVNSIRAFGKGNRKSNPWTTINVGLNRIFNYNPIIDIAMNKDNPSLIHAHFGGSGYYLLRPKRRIDIPLITAFYGTDLSRAIAQKPKWEEKYRKLFREGDIFLAEGKYMKERLIRLGCEENKVVIHHIGVDLNEIAFKSRERASERDYRILISASFREKKGIPDAITAISILKRDNPGINISVTLIGDSSGTPEDEEEKKKILGCIRQHGLEKEFRLLGYQHHEVFIKELYRNHVFLSPSITASNGDDEGGAPVSIIEASASGMPVVSTYHCDIPEVVKDGVSGYLVPERDTRQLANRLGKLLESPEKCEKMGYMGRRHIEQNYNIEKQTRILETLYDEIIK